MKEFMFSQSYWKFFDGLQIYQKWILRKGILKDFRSSCSQVFCEIDVHKKFTKFTQKHLCRSLFLGKLQACILRFYLEKGSEIGVFLCILWNL